MFIEQENNISYGFVYLKSQWKFSSNFCIGKWKVAKEQKFKLSRCVSYYLMLDKSSHHGVVYI